MPAVYVGGVSCTGGMIAERLHQAGRDRGNALGCQEALGTCFRDYIFPSSSAEMLCARPGAKLQRPPHLQDTCWLAGTFLELQRGFASLSLADLSPLPLAWQKREQRNIRASSALHLMERIPVVFLFCIRNVFICCLIGQAAGCSEPPGDTGICTH